MQQTPHRIDVNHHFLPPGYSPTACPADYLSCSPDSANWALERSLEEMQAGGIDTAIVSVHPAIFSNGSISPEGARRCNEFAARLVADYPDRFGSFAVLPMPDVEASLAEIAYALDVLKADGVLLMTSHEGRWLGDPSFTEILVELDRRHAVALVYPLAPAFCAQFLTEMPLSLIETATETSRAIANLIRTGSASLLPNLRFIFAHGGGTMPFLAERFLRIAQKKELDVAVPGGVWAELQRFYFDVARSTHPASLSALVRLAPAERILFGSDFPFCSAANTAIGLAEYELSDSARQQIDRGNAAQLFPRLSKSTVSE